jgi:DNA-binding transcriptional LysR family regulator
VLRGEGVAVLPEYFVARDLESGRLRTILTRVKPRHDAFRLVTRANDGRQVLFDALVDVFRAEPLR